MAADQYIKKLKIGTSEYIIRDDSVDGKVDAAKSEAIATAAADATSKANTAEANANQYTDTEVGAAKTWVTTNYVSAVTQDSTDGHKIKVTKNGSTSTLTIPDNNTTYTVAEGTANGKIKVTPSSGSAYEVAVHGLGSAAYTASTAYDAAGAAATAEANAKAYTFSQADITSKDEAIYTRATDYADELIADLGTVLKFKGTVATETALKAIQGAKKGDVYIVTADNSEWVATADASSQTATTTWEKFGTTDVKGALYKDTNTFTDGYILKADGTAGKVKAVAANASAVGLGNVTNNKQVKGLASGTTAGHIVAWGSDGYTVADGGVLGTAAHSATTDFDAAGAAATAEANAKDFADDEDAKIYAVSNGDHTHTVSGNAPVYKVNPTTKYMKATATGGAVSNSTTEYISALGTPTTKYLETTTTHVGNVTGVNVTPVAAYSGFTHSYDETTFCLTLTPQALTNVATNVSAQTVTSSTGVALTYATGGSTSTSGSTAGFITALGTPTKSVHSHSFTQPTVALTAEASSATGTAQFVQSVTDTKGSEAITNVTVSTTGAHEHTTSKRQS